MAEEFSCRTVDAVGAGAEINPVQINCQQFVLGEFSLQPQRQQDLLRFSFEGPVWAEEDILRQLLGDWCDNR